MLERMLQDADSPTRGKVGDDVRLLNTHGYVDYARSELNCFDGQGAAAYNLFVTVSLP